MDGDVHRLAPKFQSLKKLIKKSLKIRCICYWTRYESVVLLLVKYI